MEHHAYVLEGDPQLLRSLVIGVRAREHIDANNPNFFERVYEKFGIDEAHELRSLASFKVTGEVSYFVIAISSITTEAQQALLKLLEEPRLHTVFVLIVPYGVLIPTLRSRVLPYPFEIEALAQPTAEAKKFLSSAYKTRSAIVTALLKDDDFVKDRVRNFLYGLETVLYALFKKSDGNKEIASALEDIASVRSYVADRSPSLKMLLEHLAATLPTV